MKNAIASATILAAFVCAGKLHAQTPTCTLVRMDPDQIGSLPETVGRAAEISGRAAAKPRLLRFNSQTGAEYVCGDVAFASVRSADTAQRLSLTPLRASLHYNSGYATDRNNGAMWNGRGLSGHVTGGARLESRHVSMQVRPILGYVANDDFPTVAQLNPAYSALAYPWRTNADNPQRFGIESFSVVDAGDSWIRANVAFLSAGVSNENFWIGPGSRYSVLMTNTAGGFEHISLGTDGVVETPAGGVDLQLLWGRLHESEYFDTIGSNDRRFLSTIMLSWSPRWVPGLHVGGARVYQNRIPPEGLEVRDFFPFAEELFKVGLPVDSTGSRQRPDDQLISLFFRWAFPASGLEIYGEFGRNDHAWDWNDLVSEPDHAAAFLLGLQKTFPIDERTLLVHLEAIRLGGARTDVRRGGNSWYGHGVLRQGYTHNGQFLGASIGGESDAQYLSVDLLGARNAIGLYVERERRHDDVFMTIPRMFSYAGHDLELTLGLRAAWTSGSFVLTAQPSYSSRSNRTFRHCNERVTEVRDCRYPEWRDPNFQLPIQAVWYPGAR